MVLGNPILLILISSVIVICCLLIGSILSTKALNKDLRLINKKVESYRNYPIKESSNKEIEIDGVEEKMSQKHLEIIEEVRNSREILSRSIKAQNEKHIRELILFKKSYEKVLEELSIIRQKLDHSGKQKTNIPSNTSAKSKKSKKESKYEEGMLLNNMNLVSVIKAMSSTAGLTEVEWLKTIYRDEIDCPYCKGERSFRVELKYVPEGLIEEEVQVLCYECVEIEVLNTLRYCAPVIS